MIPLPTTHPLRFGFRTAGFRDWTLQDAFQAIARAGYHGVEVCLEHCQARPEDMTAGRARDIARLVRETGLEVASVSYHADGEPSDQRADNQRRAVGLTREFGTAVLILNAQKAEPGAEQRQWDDLRHRLEELLPVAQRDGVLIALEPEPGHFLHSSWDMRRLLDEVAHPNLAVNLDVGHAFLTDPDLGESIRALGHAIVHTHVEGMNTGVHQHLVPGQGDLDLRAVRSHLEAISYAGYYTVDLFNIADDPVAYAERSLAGLRELIG